MTDPEVRRLIERQETLIALGRVHSDSLTLISATLTGLTEWLQQPSGNDLHEALTAITGRLEKIEALLAFLARRQV